MNLFGSQLDASFKLASSYLTYKSLKINQILRGYKKSEKQIKPAPKPVLAHGSVSKFAFLFEVFIRIRFFYHEFSIARL